MGWSDPASLRALDFRGAQWSRRPASFEASARRILGANAEAVDEAVNLSLAALAIVFEILGDLLPDQKGLPFGECVRTLRADPELRGLFKARYATRSAVGRSHEFPGVPTMLTDPLCLESRPSIYWFDGETCERVVCAFISRQTLNRRRALLDVHESGVTYSLRGAYQSDEGAKIQLRFLTANDVEFSEGANAITCRYSVHPLYEYRKSVRKLSGVEVIVHAPKSMVFDLDLVTGDLIHPFDGYKLVREGADSQGPLVETPTRVQIVPEHEAAAKFVTGPIEVPSVVNHYTFSLIKRVTSEFEHQVAMNRAVTQYFLPHSPLSELSGWAAKYERWIREVVGGGDYGQATVAALIRPPEEKRPAEDDPRGVRIEGEGAALNALLAVWLHAQLHVRDLPTDASTYLTANLPKTLRDMPREVDGGKPTWTAWAKSFPNERKFSPKQLVDSWATVWKILEIILQVHNDPLRERITYSEFVEAMPIKVYANYEAEFEALRRQAPELAEAN